MLHLIITCVCRRLGKKAEEEEEGPPFSPSQERRRRRNCRRRKPFGAAHTHTRTVWKKIQSDSKVVLQKHEIFAQNDFFTYYVNSKIFGTPRHVEGKRERGGEGEEDGRVNCTTAVGSGEGGGGGRGGLGRWEGRRGVTQSSFRYFLFPPSQCARKRGRERERELISAEAEGEIVFNELRECPLPPFPLSLLMRKREKILLFSASSTPFSLATLENSPGKNFSCLSNACLDLLSWPPSPFSVSSHFIFRVPPPPPPLPTSAARKEGKSGRRCISPHASQGQTFANQI